MHRCTELELLTRELYRAISAADVAWFERNLWTGAGLVVIGSAPGEWWGDADSALKAIRAQMQSMGARIQLEGGDVVGWRDGLTGWISDRPTLRVDGAATACRHTSVFLRQAEGWRIVQHHFSIGTGVPL